MYIIGVLSFTEQTIVEVPEIERGLNKLGYAVHLEQMGVNMQSLQIGDYYYEKESVVIWLCRCLGDLERCRKAVASFVQADIDVIVAMTRPALEIALQAVDAETPIIFTHITREPNSVRDLERLQAVRKVTGVWDIWLEMAKERLSLITEVVPPPTTVHALYNPDLYVVKAEADILAKAARELNLKLILHEARSIQEGKDQLVGLQTRQDHAIFRLADPTSDGVASFMGAIATELYIPYVGLTSDELERCGALFALETREIGSLVAGMIDRILRGEHASGIGFKEPTQKIFAVNMQAAQDLGLIVSPAVLKKAQVTIPAHKGSRLEIQVIPNLVLSFVVFGLVILLAGRFAFPYSPALGIGAILILTFWMWRFLNQKVVSPIRNLSIAAEKIGSGELNTPIQEYMAGNEVDVLTRALRRMRNNLKASYAEMDQLNRELKQQVIELTEAYRIQKKTQRDLELASRRIVDAEDNQHFSLTTYIHDEIIRPLDDLVVIAQELGSPDLIRLSDELDQRVRQVRFDLSTPILQDIGLELRRLIQEVLPAVYPDASRVKISMNLSVFDQSPGMEPAYIFLLYRFVRGAVTNIYRHSHATQAEIAASVQGNRILLRVSDNGRGFDPDQIERFIGSGHYFFHDIQIRANQLGGKLSIRSKTGEGTTLEVALPVVRKARKSGSEIIRRTNHKVL